MRIPLLYGLLSVILGAYGLNSQAMTQEQPETEHMAKISASTQAARQEQARILANMITGRINYLEKNKQLENQIAQIKRRRKICGATFASLDTTIRNHQELKNFLTYLSQHIGFPYGTNTITLFLNDQTQKITREIEKAERDIRKNEKEIRKYEKEKKNLITEVNKPETISKPGASVQTQAAQPSRTSRPWSWIFGTKQTAPQATSAAQNAEAILKLTHDQLLLSIREVTERLESCKQRITRLQNERTQLMGQVEEISQQIINRLSRADVFTNEQDLREAQQSMQSLRSAYFNLDAISIRAQETLERKYALLFEIQGMEQTDY
jgi:hypothetical protein